MEQETRTARDAGAPVKIGAEAVRAAAEVLRRYRAGKQNLDRRIIDNEQFWKLRHWEQMEKAGEGGNPEDVRPASGWLVNCILSKHADAMDCYPEPTVLPREPGDRQEAETLSRILPVLLKNDRFRRTYSKAWWDKLKSGCAVYGVFWDNEKLHGLGDVSIRSMDVLNLFWEPGVTDIQESEHFFCTELVPNNHLVRRWPELEGKLGRGGAQVSRYLFDDKVDTSEQSLVVDWYYHTEREGRQVLQYCKFVGENVLYATENDPEMAARGWYDHGKYPFVFDTLFPEEGTPCGYGYVDLCKSAQKQIDLMNQAILKNTLAAATPRFFIRADGAVNENEYADWTRPFVHTNGNLGADSIAPIRVPALDSVYVAVLQNKIAEMKETAGNRDVMSGGTAGGVTAATAIAALQADPAVLRRAAAVPAAGPGRRGVRRLRQRGPAAQGAADRGLSRAGVRPGGDGTGRDAVPDHGVQPVGPAAVSDGVLPQRYGRAGAAVPGADAVPQQGHAGGGHPAGTEGDGPEGVADGGAAAGGDAAGQEPGDPSGGGAGTGTGKTGEQRRKGGGAPEQRRCDAAAAGHAAGGTAQMIRASCGGAHLTVRGHAGYGEYGKDIVCAAASALVYALAGRLRETGRLERFQSAPGYAEIAGTGDCAREFALVRCGLALLARQYPDRVEIGS